MWFAGTGATAAAVFLITFFAVSAATNDDGGGLTSNSSLAAVTLPGGEEADVPEAVVADFQRRNRFHRLVLHAVRIGDTGPESEKLLKGLAASSGGTYVWSNVPPVN